MACNFDILLIICPRNPGITIALNIFVICISRLEFHSHF